MRKFIIVALICMFALQSVSADAASCATELETLATACNAVPACKAITDAYDTCFAGKMGTSKDADTAKTAAADCKKVDSSNTQANTVMDKDLECGLLVLYSRILEFGLILLMVLLF